MELTERQKIILKIVEESRYISVNELAKMTYTSPSSIRRDLSAMQTLGLVKRTHGGVSLPQVLGSAPGFYKRATKNVKEKRIIAKRAASLLADGQNILIDSSTTASFLIPYIAKLSSATLFTNNLETAIAAVKEGIEIRCIGGSSIGGSVSLGGPMAYKALSEINEDILFFSSQSLSDSGEISDSTEAENYVRQLMLARSKQKVFLCDSEKFATSAPYTLANLDEIDYAVFDAPFPDLRTKAKILLP